MRSLSLLGVPFGRRMFILEHEGRLMLQSPFLLQPEVAGKLNQLGEVTDVVVPTIFHDTFLKEVMVEYPAATYYAVSGAEKHIHHGIKQAPVQQLAETVWNDILVNIPIDGMPRVNECLFYHKPSKTLLVSDLLFNTAGLDHGWLHLFARMMGFAGKPSPSRLFKSMIRDKQAFATSLRKVLNYDFDQILTSHFECIDTGGRPAIEQVLDSVS